MSALEAFHQANPLIGGMNKEELRNSLPPHPPVVFGRVVEDALRSKTVEQSGDLLRLRGLGVVMKDEETESKQRIEDAFKVAGLKVPPLKEVLGALKIDKARAQKIVTLLLRDKILIKISDDLVFHSEALRELRTSLTKEKARSAKIDISRFKDLAGVSRKYAIPLLEYLDREHITRRVGDERIIL